MRQPRAHDSVPSALTFLPAPAGDGSAWDRKDYGAFGDETATAARVIALGYTTAEPTRKGYTGYEKDAESSLEFAQARYYSTTHGIYTSVDPLTASASIRNPQTFNRYTYVLNSPFTALTPFICLV